MLTLALAQKIRVGVPALEKNQCGQGQIAVRYPRPACPCLPPKVAREDRSLMNVVWIMKDEALEKGNFPRRLLRQTAMVGVKGPPHRGRLPCFAVQCPGAGQRHRADRFDEGFCKQKRINTHNQSLMAIITSVLKH